MSFRTAILIVTLVFQLPILAQELAVKEMKAVPMDLSASQYERKDLAGKACALVKVQLAAYGAKFEGNVIHPVEYKTGEYWVYMSEGSYMLSVKHPNFVPLNVNFHNYGINGVQAKNTYELTLLLPQSGSVNADDGMNYLVMTVEPANASVSIDGQAQMVQNGMLSILLPMGEHRYEVSAPAYETKSGTFIIGREKLKLPVSLSSAMATLTVSCSTAGTQIYVNDELKGTTSWSGSLPAGIYRVEGRLAGYRSHRQSVTLAKLGRQQVTIPALQSVSGSLNVNYQPTNAEVWIDGRKAGSSPDIFRNLKVGRHEVEVRASGYHTKKEKVTILDGQTAMLSGSLESQTIAQTPPIAQPITQSTTNSTSEKAIETFTVNGVSFNMIRVEGGKFQTGVAKRLGKEVDKSGKTMHTVMLSTYYIGETEVTQELWEAVMGYNPAKFNDGKRPVNNVRWYDCQDFVERLNKITGLKFRLPTEAEWEYAARGGNKSRGYLYSGSNTLADVAWYKENAYKGPEYGLHTIKTKLANELGIYDMSGNVLEWCEDLYRKNGGSQTNSLESSQQEHRIYRGGACNSIENECRVSFIGSTSPNEHWAILGLRLALQYDKLESLSGNNSVSCAELESLSVIISVSCDTHGAEIYIDDKLMGTSPWKGQVAEGNHSIEARLAGYRSHFMDELITNRSPKQISIPSLQANAGKLNVNYGPKQSEVWVDGKRMGSTPCLIEGLSIGRHLVKIRKNGYLTENKTVTVGENKTVTLLGDLKHGNANVSDDALSLVPGNSTKTFKVNGAQFDMVCVEGGTFMMGATSEQGDVANDNEKPIHQVTLSSFYIGESEVTQELWEAVMGSNPSKFKGAKKPVETISWNDCQEFINKLNQITHCDFRLPTEAEWEYAARGGKKSRGYKYSGSNNCYEVAWNNGNSGNVTHDVMVKKANELGLYDMSGNVNEWCLDWNGVYSSNSQNNPIGSSLSRFGYRGGCYDFNNIPCRVSYRWSNYPYNRSSGIGLRLAL